METRFSLLRRAIVGLLVPVWVACGDESVINECGSTEIEEGTDGVVPQDPTAPEIVEACEELCDRLIAEDLCYGSADCPVDRQSCIDDCRLQSCEVCPGKLAPWIACQATHLDPNGWACADAGLSCPAPAACEDEASALGQCGG